MTSSKTFSTRWLNFKGERVGICWVTCDYACVDPCHEFCNLDADILRPEKCSEPDMVRGALTGRMEPLLEEEPAR